MKPIKMLCLAALAALMAMAFAGASSAMAESTRLCSTDAEEVVVESGCGVTHVHESTLSGAKAKLLAGFITVSCDVLFLGDTVAETSTPLVIEGSFTYTSCGSCTVKELEGGEAILEILKEGHETAKVTGEAVVFVDCGGSALECEYDLEKLVATAKGPLLSTETNGEVKIAGQVMHKHPGGEGAFCPKEAKLDITTTPLSATYLGGPLVHYCVLFVKAHGFFLAVNNRACQTQDGTRVGRYELVSGPPNIPAGTMACLRLIVEPNKGLYKSPGAAGVCADDDALDTWAYELGTIE
jgi:hypothetical protein